ncbi:MAG: radical SAM protein [Planctomycetes bacterium]|nr:radical SAM protein [Planctomycetota bacterium]
MTVPSTRPASRFESATELPMLELPVSHNYLAAFLTLACNLDCKYCINLHEDFSGGRRRILTRHLSAEQWIRALDRIPSRPDRPITLQGGEPTVYKGFYDLVAGVREGTKFDLLTNLFFDPDEFARRVPLSRFQRDAPYAPIRVSYHPGQNTMPEIIRKSLRLQDHGFRVGIYGVLHPSQRDEILRWQEKAIDQGLDFRTKEYLGVEGNDVHGTYRYPNAISGQITKHCLCRTTELLISPSGYVFRCHSDLYEARPPVGHMLDPEFQVREVFRPCFVYGHCNPCDVKVKTNRHQQFGHTSVEIVDIRDLTPAEEERLADGDNGVRPILGDPSGADFPLPVRR